MKKVLKLLLALTILFALVGCGETKSDDSASTDVKYHVGVLQYMQHNALDLATQGFEDALKDKLGDQVEFDPQDGQGDASTCNTIATTFVSNNYDLIFANATPAVQSCINATTTIPVLGTSVTDYSSIVGELTADGATGTNLSGTSDGVPASLYVKAVMDIVPDAKTVAVLYCSAEPNSVVQYESFKAAMAESNPDVTIVELTFEDSNSIQSVLTNVADYDAMYIPTDNTAAANMTLISGVTEPAGLPVICGEENMMKAGGLATVSISYYEIGYKTGEMAYEILVNGADITTMPIEYAADPVGEYNSSYAEAIGITVPDTYTAVEAE